MKKTLRFLTLLTAFLFFTGVAFPADMTEADRVKESENVSFVRQLKAALNRGSMDEALSLFDSLPASLSGDKELSKLHASLLISAARYKEASSVISSLEAANPGDIELLEMKMVLAKASGDKTAKKNALNAMIAADPNNAVANIELGQEQVLNHKYKQARTFYQKALIREPNNEAALFGYGQTSYYLDDLDNARKAFNKILAVDPQSSTAYSYLAKLDADDENYKRAENNVRKAIELDDTCYDYFMDLGTYLRNQGKFKDAEEAWTKAISIDPSYFLGYAYRAGLYDEQNMYDKALQDYRNVIKTNPKYYFAYESLGMLAWRAKSYTEAREAFELAYSINDKNISYPLIISACYLQEKKLQPAKLFLEKVMKNYQDHTTFEYVMLRLYHDQGPSNAENDIALRIQKEGNSTTRGKMLYYFALFYDMKGNTELAKKYYSEITAMNSPMFFEYRLAEWSME